MNVVTPEQLAEMNIENKITEFEKWVDSKIDSKDASNWMNNMKL